MRSSEPSAPKLRAEKLAIAAPCASEWEKMSGNESKRFCGGCAKYVYNLSAMSKSEAEDFLSAVREVPCLKFYRRADGTIMFENCPKGLRRLRDAAKVAWKAASLALAFLCSWGGVAAKGEDEGREEPPSNLNIDWTLSESGPSDSTEPFPRLREMAEEKLYLRSAPGQLAQLGSVDRYSLFSQLPQTKGLGADWSGSELFTQALQLTAQKKYSKADPLFREALATATKPGYDPMYREFIGIEYAKLLKKAGKEKKARAILAETKYSPPKYSYR
ncbi:MAG: hypothetical protein KGS72_11575 [Cyanobacteria bacterium REEB67]|nr:hypothetical protein [Cyanobacteria bacterium REEB67]